MLYVVVEDVEDEVEDDVLEDVDVEVDVDEEVDDDVDEEVVEDEVDVEDDVEVEVVVEDEVDDEVEDDVVVHVNTVPSVNVSNSAIISLAVFRDDNTSRSVGRASLINHSTKNLNHIAYRLNYLRVACVDRAISNAVRCGSERAVCVLRDVGERDRVSLLTFGEDTNVSSPFERRSPACHESRPRGRIALYDTLPHIFGCEVSKSGCHVGLDGFHPGRRERLRGKESPLATHSTLGKSPELLRLIFLAILFGRGRGLWSRLLLCDILIVLFHLTNEALQVHVLDTILNEFLRSENVIERDTSLRIIVAHQKTDLRDEDVSFLHLPLIDLSRLLVENLVR